MLIIKLIEKEIKNVIIRKWYFSYVISNFGIRKCVGYSKNFNNSQKWEWELFTKKW